MIQYKQQHISTVGAEGYTYNECLQATVIVAFILAFKKI